jgi:hypothetical protein
MGWSLSLPVLILSNRAAGHLAPRSDSTEMSLKTWIKRLGFWGFMFFLLKGLLWLTIPALIAIFATD